MALKTAALSGIDVRIMLTGVLDKRLPYWAALTYIGELLNAGVQVFYYQKGFMHAKTIVVDGTSCSIGTANMDMRSFELNYEINALIYDESLAGDMEVRFQADMADAPAFYAGGLCRHPKAGTASKFTGPTFCSIIVK